MCPMCIGAATWYFTGASTLGGIVSLVRKRIIACAREMKVLPGLEIK